MIYMMSNISVFRIGRGLTAHKCNFTICDVYFVHYEVNIHSGNRLNFTKMLSVDKLVFEFSQNMTLNMSLQIVIVCRYLTSAHAQFQSSTLTVVSNE